MYHSVPDVVSSEPVLSTNEKCNCYYKLLQNIIAKSTDSAKKFVVKSF